MTESEYERATGYAHAALALLKRASVPPLPRYFELFFVYATGTNIDLNTRINAMLTDKVQKPTVAQFDLLCEEFLSIAEVDTKLVTMSSAMSRKISDVHHAIDYAMATANSYSGSLQQASGDLDREIDKDTLKALSGRLLAETRRMQDTNRRLEDQLQTSREDIAGLQRDLDVVRRESMLDALTKLPNRKTFDEQVVKEIEDAAGRGEPLCLLMLDIDHFKRFNDTYGHLTGDQVLRLVAATLKANIKGKDMAARFGGEEFVAILPRTDLGGAISVAESIRRSVQAKELLKRSTNEKLGRITLSVGVSQLRPSDNAVSLIERADHCLYAAKDAGRNQVLSERDVPAAAKGSTDAA